MVIRLAVYTGDVVTARPLVDALAAHGVPVEVQTAAQLRLDTTRRRSDLRLVVNLVGTAEPRRAAFTTEYLAYLADIEVPVVNGLDAFVVAASRARQLALLDHLGLRHPPARVVADTGQVAVAAADLGLTPQQADVHDGPPVVVQAPPPPGDAVRCAYVGGRFHAAHLGDEPVSVDPAVQRLGEQVVRTAAIEFGGVSFAVDPAERVPSCVGIDAGLGAAPGELDRLVDYVRYRAGLAPPPSAS